jgi:hypothetical protein
MTPCKLILSTVLFCWSFLLVSCGAKNNKDSKTVTHTADSLSEPITYTVALADVNGEGRRIQNDTHLHEVGRDGGYNDRKRNMENVAVRYR